MKLQKHYTRKDKKYHKYEVVIPNDIVEKSKLKEGDELEAEAKEGKIVLVKK